MSRHIMSQPDVLRKAVCNIGLAFYVQEGLVGGKFNGIGRIRGAASLILRFSYPSIGPGRSALVSAS